MVMVRFIIRNINRIRPRERFASTRPLNPPLRIVIPITLLKNSITQTRKCPDNSHDTNHGHCNSHP
ncbi:hypothetical protein HanPSC8_Chr12g0513391 [Helianthus annuus]|nr:hypothetical protein HanPSC8_Chr12g0513391 [Helianthus annuus]